MTASDDEARAALAGLAGRAQLAVDLRRARRDCAIGGALLGVVAGATAALPALTAWSAGVGVLVALLGALVALVGAVTGARGGVAWVASRRALTAAQTRALPAARIVRS